jgi:hypothetical protein
MLARWMAAGCLDVEIVVLGDVAEFDLAAQEYLVVDVAG